MMLRMKDKLLIIIVILFFVLIFQQNQRKEGFTNSKVIKNNILKMIRDGKITVEALSKNANKFQHWIQGELISDESILEWHKLFTVNRNNDIECQTHIGQDFCNSKRNPKYKEGAICVGPSCGKCAPLIALKDDEPFTKLNFSLCERKNIPVFARNFKDIYRIFIHIKNNLMLAKDNLPDQLYDEKGKLVPRGDKLIFSEKNAIILAFVRAILHYYTLGIKNVGTTMELEIEIKVYIHMMGYLFYLEIVENKKKHKLPLTQLAFIKIWNIIHNKKLSESKVKEIYLSKNNKPFSKEFIKSLEKQVQQYKVNAADDARKEYNHIDKYLKDEATQMSINGIVTELRFR